MRKTNLLGLLGTLSIGIFIGAKFNAFGGARGIANLDLETSCGKSVSGNKVAPVTMGGAFLRKNNFHAAPPVETVSQETIASAQKLIDEMRGSELERDLCASLGADAIGLDVSRGLIAGRHSEVPGASSIAGTFFAGLHDDPRSGGEILREALRRIPVQGHERDRLTLIENLATLSGDQTETNAVALQELTTVRVSVGIADGAAAAAEAVNDPGQTSSQAALVINSHRIFVNTSADVGAAIQGTIRGIMAQQDPGIRRTLVDTFSQKYADRRGELQSELMNRGLDINTFYAPTSPTMVGMSVNPEQAGNADSDGPAEFPISGDNPNLGVVSPGVTANQTHPGVQNNVPSGDEPERVGPPIPLPAPVDAAPAEQAQDAAAMGQAAQEQAAQQANAPADMGHGAAMSEDEARVGSQERVF